LIKKTSNGYIIKVKEQYWRISTKMHTKLTGELNSTDDIFFGDPKWFYNRFVAISYVAEENSGKVWTKDEDTILEEMINDNFHIGDIASELKRDIMSIALRGAKYVDIESNIIMKIDRQSLYYTRFTEF
jgi:hypothetical protein